MVYKWCVVPLCTNTSISSPHKMSVSVPTHPKRRKMWLQLAGRDPNSIVTHSNVFMCEDHFEMEKDTINFMKYKMGFSQKILLTDGAMPSKFDCQEDRKRGSSEAGSSREVFLKRQRIDVVTECLLTESSTELHAESLQDDSIKQEIIESEELPKTQDKDTITNPIKTVDKLVQVTRIVYKHYRSKAVQTRWQNKSISTSPIKITTVSRSTSPFKIEPCHLQPLQSGVVEAVGTNVSLKAEKSDSDISDFERGHL